jgi:hypothetical protein
LTEPNRSPLGHTTIQVRVIFDRGENRGTGSREIAKIFSIPVVYGQYVQAVGHLPRGAKLNCTNQNGQVADHNFNTTKFGYQDLDRQEPTFHMPVNDEPNRWGVNCILVPQGPEDVGGEVNFDDLEVLKCRMND